MAEISLRAYVREIDDLVEHEQLDEAIAHARHILQTYPRHLDTYRLLGKAYLEAKRYGDSADILQRVLSAVPDDFIAHIGMSIVREDEGNLDAAIWHMERAFETNPSNAAVQGEMRRLIGKRDGLEPQKVRLTRGALARMYAHGDLYPQAIAELRAALTEDPDRPDLQVLLADMYWRTNQRAEAAEVAAAVLEALPNCREANRILAAALHAQGRTDEALTYHRRVAALDPYSALVESIQEDPARVGANAVRIEKLAWQPGQPVGRDTGPGEWAAGVAAGAGGRPASPRPSWLDSLGAATAARKEAAEARSQEPKPDAPPPAPEPEPLPSASQEDEEGRIPEWMEAAGWQPGTGEGQEGPISFSDDEIRSLEAGMLPPDPPTEPEGGLARADIPDWLKDVAPGEDELASPEISAEETVGATGLEEPRLPPGWSPPPGGADEDDDWLKAAAEDAPALPTWMEEDSPGATATIVTWLGDRSKEPEMAPSEPAPAEDETPESPPPARAELPEWLAEETAPEQPPEEPAPTRAPSWLSGVAEAAAKGSSLAPEEISWEPSDADEPIRTGMYPEEEEARPAQTGELPDWLQTLTGADTAARGREPEPREEEPVPAAGRPEPRLDDSGSFDWLRELAESEPPTPAAAADEVADEATAPSWLSAAADDSSRAALGRSAGPEWLRGIGEPEEAPTVSETGGADWLRGIGEPAAEPEPAERPRDESAEWVNLLTPSEGEGKPQETGEWLKLLKKEGVPPLEAPPAATPTSPPADMDDEQVFEWLESLAAKQGIPAPSTIDPTAESRPPLPPAAAERPPSAEPLPEEPAAGLDWLEQLAATQPRPDAERPEAAPAEPAAAALEMAPEPAAPEPPAPAEVRAAPPTPTPEVPDWLKQLVAETPQPTEDAAPPEEPVSPTAETWPALPEWMITGEPGEEEPTVPPLPSVAPRVEAPEPAPIDELAETWVPPWEQLEVEEERLPAGEAAEEPVAAVEESVAAREEEALPEMAEAEAADRGVRYEEPTTDVLEEVPDWLRTPAPRRPTEAVEPSPVAAEPEEEAEIPDWLMPPARPVEPVRAETPPPPPPEPEPEPEPQLEPEPVAEARPIPSPLPTAARPPRAPARAPTPKSTKPSMEDRLREARQALATGDYRRAATDYGAVIKKKYQLDDVTSELELALDRNPKAAALWQVLGDAYMKGDRLEEAIVAYERGVAAA